MKILITGGSGYIGSALIRALKGHEITIIDNFLTSRFCSLFNAPSIKLLQGDFMKMNLHEYLEDIDVCVHLAAVVNAAKSFENEAMVRYVNYHGTQKIEDACQDTNTKLLFPSTCSVYGTQSDEVDENTWSLNPETPYAESKLDAEGYIIDNNLNSIVLRFGTVYGFAPGIRFQTAINRFVWQATHSQPLTVYRGVYYLKRPYLEIGDCVGAIKHCIENIVFDGEIYNVFTAMHAPEEIIETMRDFIVFNYEYTRMKDISLTSYVVSNEKFKEEGFEYKGELRSSIKEMVEILR